MSIIDHSTMSAEQRPVRLRTRRDLVISDSVFQGERSWIVKDPVGLKYFRLRDPEHRVLQLLDGTHSYGEVTQQLQHDFPEQKIRLTDIQQLVNSFHTNGLLVSDAIGQATPLQQRRNKELKQKAMGMAASLICIRFPGVDPESFLSWLHPKVAWFFSSVFTFFNLLLVSLAGLLVLTNLTEFFQRLPDFQQFFGVNNLLFMAAVLILTKSIHELGHGLMCKHFGGECHEIGFMLMVMTPAMYCNTSDSWVLPNKWHRIAIGAAGMYVEIILAALATFGWWYTHPGVFHYFCLNVMFLSSVSTIIFNANPLLRYDGYYMLSDYLEIPNLAAKSKQAMISKLRSWCLGMKPISSQQMPQRHKTAFTFYSIGSFVYRWMVMLMIFWFLKTVFEPYGLGVIGEILITLSLGGMILIPACKMLKFFCYPGRFREVKTARTLLSTVVLATAIAAFCLFPLPHYVHCVFVIRPAEAQTVYVNQPGTLVDSRVQAGDQVHAGDTLAVLENDDLQLTLTALQGRVDQLEANRVAYQIGRNSIPNADQMLSETSLDIRALRKEIAIRQQQVDALTLVADRDGMILPPPNQPMQPDDGLTLVSWSGTPLEQQNRGTWLERETLLCYVGNPNRLKAELVVDQGDVRFLKADSQVELVCQQSRHRRISGILTNISRDELESVPRELSQNNGGPTPVKPAMGGGETPLLKSYQATVALSEMASESLLPGFYGNARIHVGSSSLGSRLWRQILTTVKFR